MGNFPWGRARYFFLKKEGDRQKKEERKKGAREKKKSPLIRGRTPEALRLMP